MKHNIFIIVIIGALLCLSCKHTATVPSEVKALDNNVRIFPDYTNIVIPSNIAPLNFMVRQKGDEFTMVLKSKNDSLVAGSDKSGIIQYDFDAWKQFLSNHKGESLRGIVYARQGDEWVSYLPFNIQIAEETIDDYVSYRLIEPGYELYRQLGIYQRNMTNFDEQPIYENIRKIDEDGHCINCHNFQNYSAKRMLFHVREHHPGTIFATDGKIEKINPKNDSILSNAVYPAWHPTEKWVVFSTNRTGQVFHIKDIQKVEALDFASDLTFYDVDKHEIRNIIKTPNKMETFPAWSPKGDRLYYCVADMAISSDTADFKTVGSVISRAYDQIKYNIMSMPFDAKTQCFGEPQLEVDCKSQGLSGTLPRISPDGQYMLYTMGKFGQFHIWHNSSDQYVKNLKTGESYPLTAANSKNSESFHNWSSNGRWIVFTTRRDDGCFTRIYITYFDKEGKAHKAFMLPQENPLHNIKLFKSYNVPEITKDASPYQSAQFRKVIMGEDITPAKYVQK